MAWRIVESYMLLVRIESMMALRTFAALHAWVRTRHVRRVRRVAASRVEELCIAMEWACSFYPKRVLCLQRSAATTMLLRRHGAAAEMVIGAHVLPFKAHAWVEVDRVIVNDKPYIKEIYQELERC